MDWRGDRSAQKPLASRSGRELRQEVVETDGQPVSWGRATNRWREWHRDALNTSLVFEETTTGAEVTMPASNRFMVEKRRELYAKLQDAARGARDAYGDALHTALLTFTASYGNANGGWFRPPADHLDDLLGSWPSIRRELARVLDGRDWGYVRMLEPHQAGYAHVHVAVFVRGPVGAAAFQPVLDAHVRNCPPAASDAHTVDGAVEVRRGHALENLGAYLSSYLLTYDEEALAAPPEVQKFNAVLWATNTRRWSCSQDVQAWMAFEPPPAEGEWTLAALELDGERFPPPDATTSVEMVRIRGWADGLDPPKDLA